MAEEAEVDIDSLLRDAATADDVKKALDQMPAGTPSWVKDNLRGYLWRWFETARQTARHEVDELRGDAEIARRGVEVARKKVQAEEGAALQRVRSAVDSERSAALATIDAERARFDRDKKQWADARAELERAWKEAREALEGRVRFLMVLCGALACVSIYLGRKAFSSTSPLKKEAPWSPPTTS